MQRHPFLDHFENKYSRLLDKRYKTFYSMFECLLNQNKPFYNLLETGTIRRDNAHEAEGMSTLLFDEFLNFDGIDGNLVSIDIDRKNVDFSTARTSGKTQVVCGDSVNVLWQLAQDDSDPFDLIYLDSMDLDWNNPAPSSLHHLKEFCAAQNMLKSGCLIVIDDNKSGVGKGGYVASFMSDIKKDCLFNDYQIGWVW
jgi:hypothetical protein